MEDKHRSQPIAMENAAFVVSIDTEMAWGLNHRQGEVYRYDDERAHLRRLVELFDRYSIPATWAVVGHLMLDGCEAVDGVKHPEIVRPDYDWFDGDWFDNDPCGNAGSDPTWYAPDVIDLIAAASTQHEIATHGFSHIIADDPGCTRTTFDSEMRAAVAAAERRDITLRSIIHPRNKIAHLDVLADHGITAYRGRRSRQPAPVTLPQRIVDRTIGSERTAVRPHREGALWNFPATIMFDIDARPQTWRLWIRQVERRLGQAVSRKSLFHVWFHPHNLRTHPEIAFEALERLCRSAVRHRQAGDLDTVTMASLANDLG